MFHEWTEFNYLRTKTNDSHILNTVKNCGFHKSMAFLENKPNINFQERPCTVETAIHMMPKNTLVKLGTGTLTGYVLKKFQTYDCRCFKTCDGWVLHTFL